MTTATQTKEPWEMTGAEYATHKGQKSGVAGTHDFYPGYRQGGSFALPMSRVPEIYEELDRAGIKYRFSKGFQKLLMPTVGKRFTPQEEKAIKDIFVAHGGFASKEALQSTGIGGRTIAPGAGFRVGHWDRSVFGKRHEQAVQQALAQGKPVPAEVLKDYPDLKKQADAGFKRQFDREYRAELAQKTAQESKERKEAALAKAEDWIASEKAKPAPTAVRDVTPKGFGPGEGGAIVSPQIQKRKGESLDEAIAREVGYQIDNGIVKLTEDRDGWKATVADLTADKPRVVRGYNKQQVLNQVWGILHPSYIEPKPAPAAKGKEPWEMTRDEWVDGHVKSPAMHREHVRLAVKEGKKVPPEVLRQYGASLFVRDPSPAIPKAAPGSPESGLQVDMMGKTTLVQPKGKGKAVTAGMDAFAKLEAMKAEAKTKEAWELTVLEYQTQGRPNYGDMVTDGEVAGYLGGASGTRVIIEDKLFGKKTYVDRDKVRLIRRMGVGSAMSDADYVEYHKGFVKTALAQGKPVPDKVLKDYPDLTAKAEAKAKAPPKPRPAPKPKAEAPARPTGARTLSREDATELLAGLELRAESLEERVDRGQAELEAMKEGQDPRLAKLTALIPRTKEGTSEITHITKGQYRKVWGREPKPQILAKDGKRVRWEYALDEIAQELHLEDKARREGVNPDEYVKRLIEGALDTKHMIAATEHELQSDRATLKAIERLKLDVKAREGEVTSAPLVAAMAASKPKPRTKAEVKAKGMLAEEALKLIARVQASRTPAAIAMDNAILAQKVLPLEKAHVWAKAPNRYDIKGIDTPCAPKGRIVTGVAYTDKAGKRVSRQPRKGWRKVRYA